MRKFKLTAKNTLLLQLILEIVLVFTTTLLGGLLALRFLA